MSSIYQMGLKRSEEFVKSTTLRQARYGLKTFMECYKCGTQLSINSQSISLIKKGKNMKEEQNQIEEKGDDKLRRKIKILYVITSVLFVALVIMSSFFYIQFWFVKNVVNIAIDALKAELVRGAPEGVDRQEIEMTLERVREAIPKAFLAFFTGKVNLGKVQATVSYAQKARDDEQWTAKEVSTLLHLMNASMKFDKEE